MEHFSEGLSHGVEHLLHELSVLPAFGGEGSQFVLTQYMFFLLVAFALTFVFMAVAARKASLVPKGISNLAEVGVEFVRDSVVVDVMGEEGKKYFPFVATVFFFILFNNLLGLIPGFKPGTGTMGSTVTWAVMVFILYNAIGIKKHGPIKYFLSFVPGGTPKALAPFIWLLEFISHIVRPLTLSVRLFANMFAGHVILGIFALFTVLFFEMSGALKVVGVLPLVLQIAMYAFEVFVAFIQAYVFTILTAVYIGGALHADEH
ncbi:MAG: F0F1 ATP synthase subunit A [Coriobacteriia bacterium]